MPPPSGLALLAGCGAGFCARLRDRGAPVSARAWRDPRCGTWAHCKRGAHLSHGDDARPDGGRLGQQLRERALQSRASAPASLHHSYNVAVQRRDTNKCSHAARFSVLGLFWFSKREHAAQGVTFAHIGDGPPLPGATSSSHSAFVPNDISARVGVQLPPPTSPAAPARLADPTPQSQHHNGGTYAERLCGQAAERGVQVQRSR